MKQDRYNLNRFIEAQDKIYSKVLKELQEGRKRSHWMWYIFPQFKHLGYSYNAKFYGISCKDEATKYLSNPILAQRLKEVTEIILNLPTNNAVEVFGDIDSLKLCSSMTLFDFISQNDVFARVIEKYFNGQKDNRTLTILSLYE